MKHFHSIKKISARSFEIIEWKRGDMYLVHEDEKGAQHWAQHITRLGIYSTLVEAELAVAARKEVLAMPMLMAA